MDRKIEIRKLAMRVNLILPHIKSEQLTEDALVMPFIQILGFDADKVRSDTKMRFRKVKKNKYPSYAIFKGDRLNMLVKCVHHLYKLEDHQVMLNNYWPKGKMKAKYVMLTNGLEYKVYSSEMIKFNDFSKPLNDFGIIRTNAGKINRMLNEHQGLLS